MIFILIGVFLTAYAGVRCYHSEGLGDGIMGAMFVGVISSIFIGMILFGVTDAASDEKPRKVPVTSLEIKDTEDSVTYFATAGGKDYKFENLDEEGNPLIFAAAKTQVVTYDRSCPDLWLSPMCWDEDPVLEIRGTL